MSDQQFRTSPLPRQTDSAASQPRFGQAARRPLLIALGLLCTALAALGLILPGLPTTPFLLLATACFARSSPALHGRLLHSRLFGPQLRHWKQHRCITPSVRWTAVAFVITGVSASLLLGNLATWLKTTVTVAAAIGLIVVFRLPVRPAKSNQEN